MFSKDLEQTIGQCYKRAREARHEFMTVEHLLLALLDNPSAQAVLRACGADSSRLRGELAAAAPPLRVLGQLLAAGAHARREGIQRVEAAALLRVQ